MIFGIFAAQLWSNGHSLTLTFFNLKQSLKIILFLLPVLVNSFNSEAQINRLKGGTSMQDESSSDNPNQKTDTDKSSASPDTAKCSYFTSNLLASYTLQPFRAPLHEFQSYNPVQKNREMNASLGNPGSATTPITFRMIPTPGFSYMHGVFDINKLNQDSIHYLVVEKPFSEVNYMMGKGKEQQLLLLIANKSEKD